MELFNILWLKIAESLVFKVIMFHIDIMPIKESALFRELSMAEELERKFSAKPSNTFVQF